MDSGRLNYCPRCATKLALRFVHGRERPICPECGLVQYVGPKVAVGCIVALDGKLILNRRAIEPGFGRWTFPSGYVDLGEEAHVAAAREAMEETGMDVEIRRLVGVYGNDDRSIVFIVYAGSVVGGELTLSEESDQLGLFALHELPELAFEHDRTILADWASGEP
ncbi:MAG: NUDIX domain-containing protein [Chloroflexota bacterium]|nr:MAG: NUDIX domain-containing protein [Chloroflexota bacterium]